jgi:predicted permease
MLLFLVACANVANLQIERLSSRRREFAVRSALGAGSTRLVSVAFVEMFLLSLAGGTAGLLLAWGGVQVVTATAAPGLGRLAMLQVNGAVLAFAAAGTVTAAILAGCVPAWRISRADPIRGLQNGWNGALTVGRGGMSSHLVTWQVALAVVLLFAGALLVRNVAGRLAFDPGFRTEGILSAEVSPDRDRYPRPTKTDTEGAHARYCRRLLEGASRLPGVSEAALSHVLPGADIYTAVGMQSEGRAFSPSMNIVSAGYFSVLSIPIVAGRAFSPADGFGTPPVLVVNAALARQQWGTERDAIGRQVTISGDPRPWTVVGVSADARDQVLWRSAPPAAHALFTQAPEDGPMTILLRTTGPDPAALARPLAALGRSLDADQPIHRLMPLRTFVAAKLARERQIVAMMAVFALLTLVLAAVGVHGMLACSVALRAREFAIRRALGSGRRLIVALVMRRTCGLLGLGLVIALPISLALRWHLAGSVGAGADEAPLLLAAAVSVVTLAALAASIASARRAVGVEPTTVLRAE